ncbi:MAG TPA: FAD-dependent oxidoreductase [Terriglobales bacterium]|nr:FAD-dependent oxidoreductase [Terriglobales bacterium]
MFKKRKKLMALVMGLGFILNLVACAPGGQSQSPPASAQQAEGTFTGTAKGFGGNVTVSVTLKDGAITEVAAEGPDETQGIGSKAIDELPAAIVKAGSAEVDGISGATFTSDAVKSAVQSALSKAKGGPSSVGFTPGTYTASAPGRVDPIVVETVFSENAILQVKVTKHNETRNVSTPAIERIPAEIVENQSLAVDVVTSCTVTSNAILAAVQDCVKQAGGDVEKLLTPLPEPVKADKTIEADVVVVGSGMSGLCAALSAAIEGANVVVFEQLSAAGGSAALSGGYMVGVNTSLHDKAGIKDVGLDEVLQYWQAFDRNSTMRPEISQDWTAVRTLLEESRDTFDFLLNNGVTLHGPEMDVFTNAWGDQYRHFFSGNRVDSSDTRDSGGSEYIVQLVESLKEKGVAILYDSKVSELLVGADGKVTGVVADTKTGKITANSDAVILATGGFSHNAELMKRLVPSMPEEFYDNALASVGNTGEGILMAEKLGAALYDVGAWMSFGARVNDSFAKEMINLYKSPLIVNAYGERAAVNYNAVVSAYGMQMLDTYNTTGAAYYIYDNKSAAATVLNENLDDANVYKANTIAELAAAMKLDAATLEAAVARYNGMCDAGVDTDFGQKTLTKVEVGPFYATSIEISYYGTFGGVKTDENGQILKADGTVIPGLYGVGEMASGKYFNDIYIQGGMMMLTSTTGRTAGAHAVDTYVK